MRRGSGDGTTRRQSLAVRCHDPAVAVSERRWLGSVVDRTDELRRRLERRVGLVDDNPGDHRNGVLVVDEVVELHLDDVADLTFGLGLENVERIRIGLGIGVTHQREQSDLRAVAVGHDEPVAQRRLPEDLRSPASRRGLVRRLERLAASQKRVPAECDDCPPMLRCPGRP